MAIHCARKGHDVRLWALEEQVVDGINGPSRENTVFLKGHKVPDGLRATGRMSDAVAGRELVLMAIPTQFVARSMAQVAHLFTPDHVIVSCSKGITLDTLETVDEVLTRVLGPQGAARAAFMSGPSFAAEVAAEAPTAVTIASHVPAVAARAQLLLSTPRFRAYRTHDVAGVELCGALKNVLAIACGVSDGLRYGANGRAALITRGTYEITKLAVARGASPLTMSGLAGMGDIVLTCTGDLSRNRTVGLRLGRGEALQDITASMSAVAEGVPTARAAHALAQKLGVECPVLEGIYRVIHEGADAAGVVLASMSRDLKPEVEGHVAAAVGAALPAKL